MNLTRQYNIDAGLLSSVVLLTAYRQAAADDGLPPDSVKLTGVVRDFHERTHMSGHPDFERKPDAGFGHYAGTVDIQLGADGKPVYAGKTRKVTGQFRDSKGRAIAPHLYNSRYAPASADSFTTSAILKDSKGKDAFEVTLVDVTFNPDGSSSWTYRVRETGAGKDLSHWNLLLDESHVVLPGTTPGYEFGVDGSTGFFGIKWDVTDGFEDQEFTIVLDGHFVGTEDGEGVLAKGGKSPDTALMFVPSTTLSADGSPYPSGWTLEANPDADDDGGTLGVSSDGGVDSAASFNQWFRDTPGVNLSKPLTLEFHRQDDGTYVFDDKDDPTYADRGGFFPIEDELFGNPGGHPDRNFHFTFELHTTFTYDDAADQVFRFVGDDDVWVYIDGKLAIDLGGVHSAREQFVDLDRMGLEDGKTYNLDFFFAERHRTQSNFRIETNLELEAADKPMMMTMAFD
ncbi:MAG: fibro-slime domain-containing protein [Phycisphaerales bacterium]|nr:fibro-slime domain-containing protein [Phycisphaerales bacterium]NNM26701.1 fibro-slime domain-containing protein [Phycisphaerales bacterium]